MFEGQPEPPMQESQHRALLLSACPLLVAPRRFGYERQGFDPGGLREWAEEVALFRSAGLHAVLAQRILSMPVLIERA